MDTKLSKMNTLGLKDPWIVRKSTICAYRKDRIQIKDFNKENKNW